TESGHSTKSKNDGTYSMELAEGSHSIDASRIGYNTSNQAVNVQSDTTIELNILLTPAANTGLLQGTVQLQGIADIISASVEVSGVALPILVTNDFGYYNFGHLPANTYFVNSAKFGFLNGRDTLILQAN